jgi:short-subunit dehydrogenase
MRRALITGASSGIGREFARLMAADGWHLMLTGRDGAALEALARELGGAETLVLDLVRPGAVAELASKATADGRPLDALINNAGFGALGAFAAIDWQRQAELLQVNVVAATELVHRLLPALKAQPRGYILNDASVAGFLPGPFMAVYYASKAYLLSWSEALAEELRGTTVSVTALCPGPTRTAFNQRAGIGRPTRFNPGSMDARSVAEIGYRGMLAGRAVVVPGVINGTIVQLLRLTPRVVARRGVRRFQESRG